MSGKACRIGKAAKLFALMILFGALLGGIMLAVQGRYVIRTALDGRRGTLQHAYMSQFSLREQMHMEQAEARVRGWQSLVGMQEVFSGTQRGKLFARLYDPIGTQAGAPWALVLHGGLGTDNLQVQDVACALSLQGYRVLTPDLHAHGRSEGEIASLGLMDAQDVHSWIEWILLEDMDARIVIYGVDEGAAAALIAAAKRLPECVYALAADSAYVSVQARAHELLAQSDAGLLGKYLLDPMYRLVHGTDIAQGEIVQRIAGASCPILLIHGTGDEEVLAWQSEDIAFAAGDHAQLLLVEGAGHGRARFLEPQTYYDTLLGFYRQNLGR